jgi:hypothetical protein
MTKAALLLFPGAAFMGLAPPSTFNCDPKAVPEIMTTAIAIEIPKIKIRFKSLTFLSDLFLLLL